MNNQGEQALIGEQGLDALFNGDVRQFANTVRDTQPPQLSSQYPTRGEINRQIMDATRPLLEQITELTRMVATLVEPRPQNTSASSSNVRPEPELPLRREGNEFRPNHQPSGTRSDMVTGVPSNPPQQHLLAPTSRFENTDEYDDRESISESRHNSQMDQILDSLQQTARIMSSAQTQGSRVLQTHVPIFKGSPDKYNEFEHLLINYLQPHQSNMTQKAQLQFFQSLLRDAAIDFWQSLNITDDTTLDTVLRAFRKEY